jgi:hypothetical protein
VTLLPIVQVIEGHFQRVPDVLPLSRTTRAPSPAAKEHGEDVFRVVHASLLQTVLPVLVVPLALLRIREDFVGLSRQWKMSGSEGERVHLVSKMPIYDNHLHRKGDNKTPHAFAREAKIGLEERDKIGLLSLSDSPPRYADEATLLYAPWLSL